jgi:hypothetical protein
MERSVEEKNCTEPTVDHAKSGIDRIRPSIYAVFGYPRYNSTDYVSKNGFPSGVFAEPKTSERPWICSASFLFQYEAGIVRPFILPNVHTCSDLIKVTDECLARIPYLRFDEDVEHTIKHKLDRCVAMLNQCTDYHTATSCDYFTPIYKALQSITNHIRKYLGHIGWTIEQDDETKKYRVVVSRCCVCAKKCTRVEISKSENDEVTLKHINGN